LLVWLERFSDTHQHTIAALEAVSTFAAVVVSLVLALLAHRSSRTRIKAWVNVSFIAHQTLEGKPKPEYLTVRVTNIGLMPVSISMGFFQWKLPFHREYWQITPWDYARHDPWVPQRVYPTEIKPRSSQTFFLQDIATFRSTMAESLQPIWLARWRIRFIKAIICTDDGQLFEAKLDKEVRRALPKIARTAKALSRI
jgi:hypothetical protein